MIHISYKMSDNFNVNNFKKELIYGFLIVIPLASVIWLIEISITVLTDPISQLIGFKLNNINGILLSIGLLWLIGVSARIIVSRSIFPKIEQVIIQLPLISILYRSMKQIAHIILNRKHKFIATVFIEYPTKGIWSLGFITNQKVACLTNETDKQLLNDPVSVFVPSTPNPTNGIFVFVERSSVTNSNLSVEEGIRCLMSAGMITPQEKFNQ